MVLKGLFLVKRFTMITYLSAKKWCNFVNIHLWNRFKNLFIYFSLTKCRRACPRAASPASVASNVSLKLLKNALILPRATWPCNHDIETIFPIRRIWKPERLISIFSSCPGSAQSTGPSSRQSQAARSRPSSWRSTGPPTSPIKSTQKFFNNADNFNWKLKLITSE